METNNKAFSLNLLAMAAVAGITAGLMYVTTHFEIKHQETLTPAVLETEVEEKVDYNANVQLMISHKDNTCSFHNSQYFTEVIKVEYPEKIDEVAGRWTADRNLIELMQPGGLDILTVAHEVSHAVDSILGRQAADLDHHYEAYLQGVLTSCVSSILEEDLKEAGLNRFGW